MGKIKIDYYNDNRAGKENLAPLQIWDRYTHHLAPMLERDQNSLLDIFAEHSATIYHGLKTQNKKATESAIRLAQHQRLERLLDMLDNSNPLDFYFIKLPAWWLSDLLYRRQERRIQNA